MTIQTTFQEPAYLSNDEPWAVLDEAENMGFVDDETETISISVEKAKAFLAEIK